jgi:hypothetical protein
MGAAINGVLYGTAPRNLSSATLDREFMWALCAVRCALCFLVFCERSSLWYLCSGTKKLVKEDIGLMTPVHVQSMVQSINAITNQPINV